MAILVSSTVAMDAGDFTQEVDITWGDGRAKILNGGRLLTLSLDQASGSGFQSKNEYLYGKFDMQIKLVPGNSAGTVVAYYVSNSSIAHITHSGQSNIWIYENLLYVANVLISASMGMCTAVALAGIVLGRDRLRVLGELERRSLRSPHECLHPRARQQGAAVLSVVRPDCQLPHVLCALESIPRRVSVRFPFNIGLLFFFFQNRSEVQFHDVIDRPLSETRCS